MANGVVDSVDVQQMDAVRSQNACHAPSATQLRAVCDACMHFCTTPSQVFATIMTLRQYLSILLSCVLFKHSLSEGQWLGTVIVFGTLGYQLATKPAHAPARGCGKAAAAPAAPAAAPLLEAPVAIAMAGNGYAAPPAGAAALSLSAGGKLGAGPRQPAELTAIAAEVRRGHRLKPPTMADACCVRAARMLTVNAA